MPYLARKMVVDLAQDRQDRTIVLGMRKTAPANLAGILARYHSVVAGLAKSHLKDFDRHMRNWAQAEWDKRFDPSTGDGSRRSDLARHILASWHAEQEIGYFQDSIAPKLPEGDAEDWLLPGPSPETVDKVSRSMTFTRRRALERSGSALEGNSALPYSIQVRHSPLHYSKVGKSRSQEDRTRLLTSSMAKGGLRRVQDDGPLGIWLTTFRLSELLGFARDAQELPKLQGKYSESYAFAWAELSDELTLEDVAKRLASAWPEDVVAQNPWLRGQKARFEAMLEAQSIPGA